MKKQIKKLSDYDYERMKDLVLVATILKVEHFGVNPKYPEYWEVVKGAVE
jgi:hypothetical protein